MMARAPVTLFGTQRRKMVEQQLRGVQDSRVVEAMAQVPREHFIEGVMRSRAYEDRPLPIGEGQTISQPRIVARMTELLDLHGHEKVLEIGTGSGYQTAILALLAREVISVERIGVLARAASKRLAAIGITGVRTLVSDGTMGRSELAPYDAILVTAGAPALPQRLIEQLAIGGRLVVPVGPAEEQVLIRVTRGPDREDGSVQWSEETHDTCRFVPLIGRFGWKEE